MADVRGAARVIDGDTLEVAGTRVRLLGIDAPELSQRCDGPRETWPCGQWSRRQLNDLVRGRDLICTGTGEDRFGRRLVRCEAAGQDLARAMVEAGAALAYRRYSLEYLDAEARARAIGVGLWQWNAAAMIAPQDHRAAQRRGERAEGIPPPHGAEQDGTQGSSAAPAFGMPGSRCLIKGNISPNGRIFHQPGQRHYARTRIDPARGERWFCSTEEALAAGWRAALD